MQTLFSPQFLHPIEVIRFVFFLSSATNLSVSNENDWKLGPEFTFLVHFNLTINNNTDMYHLNAASFSTCRPKDMNTLSCYLDPLKGDASEHNLITKRFQRQDQQSVFGNIPFEIMYSAKGVENYTFPKNVSENAQFQMAIKAIVNLMNIRSDVMNKTEESFVETDTFLLGECHTKYHIKQLSEVEKKENKEDFGLQFPSSFQKTTDKPLEIKKDRDLKNCKSFTNVLLSAFDVHGVENPKVVSFNIHDSTINSI